MCLVTQIRIFYAYRKYFWYNKFTRSKIPKERKNNRIFYISLKHEIINKGVNSNGHFNYITKCY